MGLDALSEVQLEHENIRSRKEEGVLLSLEDYKKMEFTHNVINEALRCGNVVKFVHREALKDVKFKDYFIPSGWKVLPVFTAVHLDSSLHPNAPHFDPWRWTGDQTCKKFTPFGGGSRFCPGSELAKVEVSIFLHHLVQNFRWSSEDSDGPLAFPYVEFEKGLLLNLEHCTSQL
ncbi:Cytochrome P450 724B1 [Linum perenne]